MKPIAWLVLLTGLPGALGAIACAGGLWDFPWEVPVLATAIVLLPAALSLGALILLKDRPPEERLVLILAGTFLRMGAALIGGALAWYFVPAVRERALPFASWGLVLYLVSLAVETALGMRLNPAGRNPQTTEMDH